MKTIAIAMIAVLAAPVMTLAAEKPATRPARPDSAAKSAAARREGAAAKTSPQEIEETLAFIRKNFKNQDELIARLPENAPYRNTLLPRLANRYRPLLRMQEQNPELFDQMFEQAKLEDEAIGHARDMRAGKPEAEARLRETVQQIIDNGLKNRQERIAKLRAALEEQERKLSADQENATRLVEQQVAQTTQMYERFLRPKDRERGESGEPGQEINARKVAP